MPNKLLGQHFLKNTALVQKIVDALRPERGEIIFEVGAGHGELTRPLAEACVKNGCALFAIEKDRHLAEGVAEQFRTETEVKIIPGDALEFFRSDQFEKIIGENGGGSARGGAGARRYKIVGNLPYYLTGHLLRIVSELKTKPERCIFMVQKEVAERIVAKPPKMNRLAAIMQFWATITVLATVPKENFLPVPEVDSALVRFELAAEKERGKNISADRYYAAVRRLFAQPRKTALNNLSAHGTRQEKEAAAALLQQIGIQPGARPQTLGIKDIAAVAGAF